ncbi:hypothetical protein [Luteibacter sp. 3190]|uniref:hypothetical protein n=1 Tax=Luteibacter sp. 3190 TaxID=2817736 RepID=UPI002862608E|nr:hypothetical protein [Luteibacter sp. 3190]MDR6935330.1 hypothetical protein [Luteibacter sp. 3190]
MTRAASRFDETANAIDELLRVSPVADPLAVASGAREAKNRALKAIGVKAQVECMLSAAATKALFSALDSNRFVSREVVAAYCDCSILTLERRLKLKHSRVKNGELQSWRKALQDPPPHCDARGYFRWRFVKAFAKAWDAERKRAAPVYKSKKKPAVQLMALLKTQFRFLRHRDGNIEAAWGQGGITVVRLIEILHSGGRLVALTAPEALAHPWANPAARAPWERAVAGALADLERMIAEGRAQTSAIGISAAMGSTRPFTARDRL